MGCAAILAELGGWPAGETDCGDEVTRAANRLVSDTADKSDGHSGVAAVASYNYGETAVTAECAGISLLTWTASVSNCSWFE